MTADTARQLSDLHITECERIAGHETTMRDRRLIRAAHAAGRAEGIAAGRAAIKLHNDGLQADCDARADSDLCKSWKSRGGACSDCPRGYSIKALP